MARLFRSVCATALTPRRCVSCIVMTWRARATVNILIRSRRINMAPKKDHSFERAVLAGGCFWGMQDLIRKLPGVVSTRVGYTGGDTPNATYRSHGTHAEGIEIVFDATQTSYRKILAYFFRSEEHTSELQSLMRISYAVFCLKKKTKYIT